MTSQNPVNKVNPGPGELQVTVGNLGWFSEAVVLVRGVVAGPFLIREHLERYS